MRYDVVIVGFRLNASLKPAQALQLVLGMDAETSKELTRRFPAAVLSGVSLSRAERVSGELTDAGAKVEVRESRLSLAHDGGAGAAAREGGNGSTAERPAVIAELPDGSRRAPPHSERHEEASGNYEIGEILAPLGRGAMAPAPVAQAPTPVTRRASREELDQALRDSLRPAQAAEPPEPAPAATPVKGEKGKAAPERMAAPQPEAFELMDNSAFAGMQNFGGGLDGFAEADDAPKLQVDEVALRSIQRRPEADARATSKQPALGARLGSWWSNVSSSALEWGAALLSLLVVTGITLLAVGYALDPEHVLRPIGLDALPAGAKKLFAGLFGG